MASLVEGCGKKGNPAGPGGGGGGGAQSLATVTGARAGSTVTVNVGNTALATVGGAALVQAGSDNFLVTQTGSGSFSAFSAICTHEQCIVTGFQSGAFVCPCHGSRYNTSGQVVQGPATRALTPFTTQFTNNVLTITT